MSSNQQKVRIYGAGFSGLTCAYYLVKAGLSVEIIEKSSRSGGMLSTLKTPYGIVETAANALLNSEHLEALAKEIGLTLLVPMKESKSRFVFRGGPSRFPVRFNELFSLARFIFKMIFMKNSLKPQPLESLDAWGARTLGSELSHYTIETALQGIYAGNPQKLSASLVLKNLFNRTRTKTSKGSRAPLSGLTELIDKLQIYLKSNGVHFSFNEQSKILEEVSLPTVFALPAYETSNLLSTLEPELADNLMKVKYLPIITANIFFGEKSACLKGYGCLFAPEESSLVLGVLLNDCIFEGRALNAVSENWIMGGAFVEDRKEFLAKSNEEILEMVLTKRRLIQPTEVNEVLDSKITRWERAFPAYEVDLEILLPKFLPKNKSIYLHGNYLGELGLTKILERSSALAKQIQGAYV